MENYVIKSKSLKALLKLGSMLLLCLFFMSNAIAQDAITVSGQVTDDKSGEPLVGVNIIVQGTTNGTITDMNGNFTLSNVPGTATLVLSSIGYESKSVSVENQTSLNIKLTESTVGIDEVVVIGYGSEKKSLVTGTISKVNNDEITQGVVLSAAESLQGRAAGVIVQSASGQPGDGLSVNIRGVSTAGNSQPLYIVDGMPVDDISFLNPSDIKSMEVLKDAAAASIYGARGGNGVIIVTTSSGEKGMTITYDGYYGFQNPWKKPEVLNAYEYATIMNETARNDGADIPFPDAAPGMAGTDWWDQIVNKNAPITNHNVTIAGGGEKSTFNSSFSYFSQEGTFAEGKSNYERFTARLNSKHEYGILTFGNNLAYTNANAFGFNPNSGLARGAMITTALNYDPTAPIYGEDGEYYFSEWGTGEYSNPVATLDIINNETLTNRILGNIFADIKIIEGLNFRTSVGVDGTFISRNTFNPEYFFTVNLQNPSPNVGNRRETVMQWQIENTLTYQKTFGDHSLTALVGQSSLQNTYEGIIGTANQLQFNNMDYAYINNTLNTSGSRSQGTFIKYRLASYFGRVSYNFKEKYLFSAVLRADGSSRFGPENKFGYFPSVSGGWVISRESFFPESEIFNFAKLRASWGQNGNDRIGDFAYTALLGINTYTLGDGQSIVSGMAPLALANEALKWETIEQLNFGLDLGFFSNKLNFNADYYVKTTKDILITPDVPAHAGANAPSVNGGDVENKGFELELNYKDKAGDFDYSVGLAFAHNTNTMTKINNANKSITGASGGLQYPNTTMAFEGEAINSFYGLQTTGVFQNSAEITAWGTQPLAQPGDLKFVDQNGDGVIDDNDRVILGNPIPKMTMGLNATIGWKGIDFSIFAYSALDYQIFNGIRRHDYPNQNWQTSVLDRWTGEGTSSEVPRVTFDDPNGNYSRVNAYMIENADMLRIKKLTLGYTLPKTIVEKAKLSRARIYVAVENAFTWTKYSGMDPEIGSANTRDQGLGGSTTNAQVTMNRGIDNGVYPMARTFLFGLNLTF